MPYWFWIILVLFLIFGFFGGPALHWGAYGWSPLGLLVVVLVIWLIARPRSTL